MELAGTLAFIGGGNMARSLAGGLVSQGLAPDRIVVADPVDAQLAVVREQLNVRTTRSNRDAVAAAAVVVLAVKPQEIKAVAQDIAPALRGRDILVISVAAGIRTNDLSTWLGGVPVVRTMPNRPALQNCGITGLYAPATISVAQRTLADAILGAVGKTVWVEEESHLDAVTAISGSGPAYFFLLMEMMAETGRTLGLSADVSRQLAIETGYGAGVMARSGTDTPEQLRAQVTSKGGTTEAALKHLEAQHVRDIFAAAIAAAARRSAELAEQTGR